MGLSHSWLGFIQICGLFIFNDVYMCMSVYTCMNAVPPEARRGHWIPAAKVTGSCEVVDVGARN